MSSFVAGYRTRLLRAVDDIPEQWTTERYVVSKGALILALNQAFNFKGIDGLLGPIKINSLIERTVTAVEELAENPHIKTPGHPANVDPEPS